MVSFQPRSPGPGRIEAAAQHLERCQVQMHRVVQVGHQPPDLDVAESRVRQVPAGVERLAVDHPASTIDRRSASSRCPAWPLVADAIEPRFSWNAKVRVVTACDGSERLDLRQHARHGGVIGRRPGDDKPHHLRGAAGAEAVHQGHLGADRVCGEIHDHLGAFGGCQGHRIARHRRGQQSAVTGDLHER